MNEFMNSTNQPTSVADLCDTVRRAAADAQAIFPFGGRTMLAIGKPPSRPGIGVDLRNLATVIDYPARDMTITVQTGITLARLQALLEPENQRLPIDVARAEQATLGGALAVNASGSRRYGFGTWRDYVIGITVVNDEGQEVKAGGRVVKNVAGYDFCKLYVGSLGTLGIITQVTLKLKPRPEHQAIMMFGVESPKLEAAMDLLHRTRTRPVCIDVLNRDAAKAWNVRGAPWLVAAGFEDNLESVQWQVRQLSEELATFPSIQIELRQGAEAIPVWQHLTELPALDENRLTFKANLLPHAIAAFCVQAQSLLEGCILQAHAGNGIVIGHLPSDTPLPTAQSVLQALRKSAVASHGNLIIQACPAGWQQSLPIWGEPREDLWLMKLVKERLDPRHLFNPGRFCSD